jgi:hypothetical protein
MHGTATSRTESRGLRHLGRTFRARCQGNAGGIH